ncbi:oxidoreductase [Paenibacillus sp. S150]|uniref:oxidoreductase n=1 Tax=Paenibacillus sp. S150 TaxID=2749826 RepID=UPI001C58CB71|nr:oxidoreductase [Paenibacillus sp. S150]MBW4081165.1 oxidoreductase [Paenibacillus sp. S150]
MGKKVILITGASSGIGKATAQKLLSDGHIVYAAARRVEQMRDLHKSGAVTLSLDITHEEDIQACIGKIIKEQGRIDVLFNNAGFGLFGSVEEVSLEDARYQFDVNLFGLARMTQLVVPYMREQRSGKIINTSSVAGKMYGPLVAWYTASKHALEGWSDCLRLELKPFGIDVVIIEPGTIETAFGDVVSGPLLKQSGNGPYKSTANSLVKTAQNTSQAGGGSSPVVVANAVSKAIAKNNPKIRYAVGKLAKPIIFLRKWLGDRNFDRLIMSQMK